MQMKEVEKGNIMCERGSQVKALYLIGKGVVRVTYRGGSYILRAGDVIGICELGREGTVLQYQAEDKVSLIPYAATYAELKSQMVNSGESVRFFISSLFKQLNELGSKYRVLQSETEEIFRYLRDSYEKYVEHCEKKAISPGTLSGYEELAAPAFSGVIPEWLGGYYATIEQMLTIWDHNNTDYDFVWGFLSKAGADVQRLLTICARMQAYKEEVFEFFLNERELDLYGMYTGLYLEELEENGSLSEQALQLKMKIGEIQSFIMQRRMREASFCQNRWDTFEKQVKALESRKNENGVDEQEMKAQTEELAGSLDKIFAFAECDAQTENNFRKYLQAYKKLPNKNGSEDVTRALRRELTALFYKVYIAAFQVSIKESEIPTVIRMFFEFGYVDEELAGIHNALYLYQTAKNMPTNPEKGVYSFYEWLIAVYNGKKEPGRNEFDLDYPEYLREQKKLGKMTAEQEKMFLESQEARVMYELEHVFPSVNKVTYGRPSTFCPVFSKHNVLKPLDTTLVSAKRVTEVLDEIRSVDYGAFYRETLFAEPDKGVPREMISVEVLPDIILTPNVGSRGIMWQEIEGKKRTTPARMMCSVFQMEDLSLAMLRLAAEFRWEMCKRVQGARWNDVTERSLTSEYCDYAQFYRKNKDLSPETKERIKTQIGKAKNSYKEMFIMDYIQWVRYESIGSPRLNKIARGIMFTYCPFPEEIRNKLTINPLYRDYVERHRVKTGQKLHHMDNLYQKLSNLGKPVPEEIARFREFLET